MTDNQNVIVRPMGDRAAKARAARRRYADERLADRLRAHGWLCLTPESVISKRRLRGVTGESLIIHARTQSEVPS